MASVISRFSISDELKVMFILEKDAQTKASKKFGFTMKITFWKKYKKKICAVVKWACYILQWNNRAWVRCHLILFLFILNFVIRVFGNINSTTPKQTCLYRLLYEETGWTDGHINSWRTLRGENTSPRRLFCESNSAGDWNYARCPGSHKSP